MYLEQLALRMQKGRAGLQEEREREAGSTANHPWQRIEIVAVAQGRDRLQEILGAMILEREYAGANSSPEQRHSVQRLVDAWLDYLAEGTGLLVERQPGLFEFVHLSLMEYLAACELGRSDASLQVEIATPFHEAAWTEVCLLAIGQQGQVTNRPFLSALFAAISERKPKVPAHEPDPAWAPARGARFMTDMT